MPLWHTARWQGAAFINWGDADTPLIAFLFADADAAVKIFEGWRQRFGASDPNEDIYLAILQEISADSPSAYRILVTSRPKHNENESIATSVPVRMQTMYPTSSVNLNRFLDAVDRAGSYRIAPALWTGQGEPEFMFDLAITKHELHVKKASEVRPTDIEYMGLYDVEAG